MGNEAPGSEKRRQDPNSQGSSSPEKKEDRSRSGQMEQAGRGKQPGGSQQSQDDKEKDRSKSGAQRPD
jgi:hypothetical protein